MYADNKSSQAFLYSKCQKWLEKVLNYWKKVVEGYNERLDEGAIIDSQAAFDHGICPMDRNVMVH